VEIIRKKNLVNALCDAIIICAQSKNQGIHSNAIWFTHKLLKFTNIYMNNKNDLFTYIDNLIYDNNITNDITTYNLLNSNNCYFLNIFINQLCEIFYDIKSNNKMNYFIKLQLIMLLNHIIKRIDITLWCYEYQFNKLMESLFYIIECNNNNVLYMSILEHIIPLILEIITSYFAGKNKHVLRNELFSNNDLPQLPSSSVYVESKEDGNSRDQNESMFLEPSNTALPSREIMTFIWNRLSSNLALVRIAAKSTFELLSTLFGTRRIYETIGSTIESSVQELIDASSQQNPNKSIYENTGKNYCVAHTLFNFYQYFQNDHLITQLINVISFYLCNIPICEINICNDKNQLNFAISSSNYYNISVEYNLNKLPNKVSYIAIIQHNTQFEYIENFMIINNEHVLINNYIQYILSLIELCSVFYNTCIVNVNAYMQQDISLRTLLLQFLFKCLLSKFCIISKYSYISIKNIIQIIKQSTNTNNNNNDNIIPKDIIVSCMHPLINCVQHPSRLSLSNLKSLQYIIQLVPSNFYVQFGDKFLENLKYWIQPEKLMAHNLWTLGEEVIIATEMIYTLHLLPFKFNTTIADSNTPTAAIQTLPIKIENPTMTAAPGETTASVAPPAPTKSSFQFIEDFVTTMCRLEKCRLNFKHVPFIHSSFITAFTKFLAAYPKQLVGLFFDAKWLARNEVYYSTLFL
jgi:hypothetical protein